MPDMIFEESCPCGNRVKLSGYISQVEPQIVQWRNTHNSHANAIAKSIARYKDKPAQSWPDTYPKTNKSSTDPVLTGEEHDLISVDIAEPVFGIQVGKGVLKTHSESYCSGPIGENGRPICCVHNPSKHHMVTWPQNWRGDKGMMERMCLHGVGHPDPDDVKVIKTEWAGIHGCDGCCIQLMDAA